MNRQLSSSSKLSSASYILHSQTPPELSKLRFKTRPGLSRYIASPSLRFPTSRSAISSAPSASQASKMPCIIGHRCSRLGRRATRKLLGLSRKTVNLLHPSFCTAAVTKRKGERFSLISFADFQATAASQVVRNLQRESVSSGQTFGFHVVCGECDGFVVRNGAVRNCHHLNDSPSSISHNGGRRSQNAADQSGAQAARGLGIDDQPFRDHETLMQDWREWSQRWERSVKSR